MKGDLSTETEFEDIINFIGEGFEDNPDLQYLIIGRTDIEGDKKKQNVFKTKSSSSNKLYDNQF